MNRIFLNIKFNLLKMEAPLCKGNFLLSEIYEM